LKNRDPLARRLPLWSSIPQTWVSHRARRKAIEDQVARATNDKIRLMKESELVRANADFVRRMAELQQAANSGDIRATPVVFGTISVTRECDR